MKNNQQNTFQNATGKIDYTLMNDYMFRAVMEKNKNVLKRLICALLHLNPQHVKSVIIHIKPAYHIGIVDFTPFPDYPEFYATNKMINVKKHYIYNDNFTLNVLDLNHIELATEEDKAYKIDYWARLFKAKTWEELKMLAQKDDIFEETSEAIYNLNQDDVARYWCQMREEGERVLRTYRSQLAERDAVIANMQAENAKIQAENAALKARLGEK